MVCSLVNDLCDERIIVMKDIVIIGAGDFGKEVAWLIEDINKVKPTYQISGFLDDDEKKIGKSYNGYECLGPIACIFDLMKERGVCAVIAMQDSGIRKRIVEKLSGFDAWETLIHPSVNMSHTSAIGKGCIVCAGSNISVNTTIGDHCIFNLSVTMGHDCTVKDYVSIMSGSCVCGHVTIGQEAYLSTNCTIVPGKKVGAYARVGAGSVVLRNVKDSITVMGVPAKVLKLM